MTNSNTLDRLKLVIEKLVLPNYPEIKDYKIFTDLWEIEISYVVTFYFDEKNYDMVRMSNINFRSDVRKEVINLFMMLNPEPDEFIDVQFIWD